MRTVFLWIFVFVFVLAPPFVSAGNEQCRWDTPYFAPLRTPVSDLAVGNGVAVAVGNRFISWSSDGVAWFKAKLPFRVEFRAVTWTGSQFVAVGSRFARLISRDGVEWEGTIADEWYGGAFHDVCGYGDQSILVVYGGIRLYTDVLSDEYTLIEAPESLDKVASNGSTIVAAGKEGAWVTHDREHWERIDEVDWDHGGYQPDDPNRWDVQWNGRYFVVATPGGIARSEDGVEWTRIDLEFEDILNLCPNQSPYASLTNVSIPEGSSGDWILLATSDFYYNELRFPVAKVCSIRNILSPEPEATMGEIQLEQVHDRPRIVAGSIADVDFLLGYTGAALRGGQWTKILDPFWLDGPDWIERHGDELASFGSVEFGWFGGSNTVRWGRYEISVSRDLLSWQQRYESDFWGYRRPLHLGDLWLLHADTWGEDSYEYFVNLWSTDLVHFSREAWSEWDDHGVFPVGDFSASSGQRVVVIHRPYGHPQSDEFYSSTDLSHWVVSPSNELWRDVTWSGQKFVAVAESGIAGLSEDGEQWTVSTIDPDIELNNVESGGGVTIATGQRRGGDAGFAYISEDDGRHWRGLPSWRGFGVAESGELHWIGDRFLIDTESGVRTSVDGREWSEPSGLPWAGPEWTHLPLDEGSFYGTIWGGLVRGERTIVRDDSVVFHERCSGQIPFPSAEDRQLLPVTASILGHGGQPWVTEVSVANITDIWQRLAFASADRGRVEEVYLPPRAQTTIGDINAQVLRSHGRLEAIEVAASHDIAVAGSITALRGEGRLGQEVPPAKNSGINVGTEGLFIAGLVEDRDFRTNLGVSNLGDSDLTVVEEFLSPDGTGLGSQEISVPAHEVVQSNRVLRQLGEPAPEAASAVLRAIDPDARYSAWASVIDNRTSDPCTNQAVPGSDGVLVLPAVADVMGASGEHWRSSIDLFNPGESMARLSLTPLKSVDYSGSMGRVEMMVPSKSTVHVANVLKDLFQGRGSAALRVEVLEGKIVASSRTWKGDNGTVGQGIPALPVPEQLQPGDRLILAGLHENGNRRTNLALVNLEDFSARVRLTLWSSLGEQGPVRTLTLMPQGLIQLNAVLRSWPDPRPESGWAEVEIIDQSARVLAFSSAVDQGTSDPTFHQARVTSGS